VDVVQAVMVSTLYIFFRISMDTLLSTPGRSSINAKMALLFILAMIIIGLIHYEAFRTVQAIILPLVTALISVVWGLGVLGAFNVPMDAWNSMTPILILAVAAGHAVQILKRYYEEFNRFGDNRVAVIEAVSNVGTTMLTAGFAAIIGFLSLTVFEIRTVRVFGIFTAIGIFSALILEMTFIPAIRSFFAPAPKEGLVKERKSGLLSRFLEKITDLVLHKPVKVLLTSILILFLSLIGGSKIELNNSFIEAFYKKDMIRVDDDFINHNFAGTSTMNILIEGKEIDSIKSPQILEGIDKLQRTLEKKPQVGKTVSLANYVKRMHMAMNKDNPDYYEVPKNRNLIAQYLLLLDSKDLEMVVEPEYRSTVIRIFTKTDHAAFSEALFSETKALVADIFKEQDVTVEIAGGSLATLRALNENVVNEKIQNIWQVTVILFIVASIVLQSLIGGLFIIIPSLLAIVVNFGFMGATHTWLSLSTAAVSALTISIGADYAFYFVLRYREEIKKYNDHKIALKQTMLTSGKAIFFVSSAIAGGFAVLLFSKLVYHQHLGGLVALSMLTSSLCTVTLLPALITLFKPGFVRIK